MVGILLSIPGNGIVIIFTVHPMLLPLTFIVLCYGRHVMLCHGRPMVVNAAGGVPPAYIAHDIPCTLMSIDAWICAKRK